MSNERDRLATEHTRSFFDPDSITFARYSFTKGYDAAMSFLESERAQHVNALRDAMDEIEKLNELLQQCKDHCACERFNTKGFDYSETHRKLGKPDSGKRWLTPTDIIGAHMIELTRARKALEAKGEK